MDVIGQYAKSFEFEKVESFGFLNSSHEKFTQGRILKKWFSMFGNHGEEVSATFNVVANVFSHAKESIIVSVVGRLPQLKPALLDIEKPG